jgi:hypothetical protein
MASISERENRQIEEANASGNTHVVFIHGLWVLQSSWGSWIDSFREAGYALPNRGQSLTIDGGWRDVAQTTLGFVMRFETEPAGV